ncbi:plasmid mobilization relaxosome protein MobC [Pseudorhodobacter sp. E13]|uniref:plasmid mobilization protein n=1 Tax=Pseudorhodobacter sp. E13 TaxID=2487931 RepID=UPI000F8CB528|nr:plasmid mobilization relaxosome protein MobC [Pseudorhodobacter sp. E13]RUS63678.1 plasmid mobilization relaxosome protein MobC [Pseudorhodobacter sp. E13]
MRNKPIGIGRALSQGLRLSSDATHAREKSEEAERASYRRQYWQSYSKKVKRIFGTVSPDEYEAAQLRADDAGRSVWGQVWAESQAYCSDRAIATGEIADLQRELVAELRRIGNNLNQLARLGYIQNRKQGALKQSDDTLTVKTMQQLSMLEAAVTKFDDGTTIKVLSGIENDH